MKYTDFNPKTMNIVSYCQYTGMIKAWSKKHGGEVTFTLPKWIITILQWEHTRGQADKMKEIKSVLGISSY